MNSNNVPRFSGDGAVTKILLKPYTIAEAIDIPSAADFPRPRPAVRLMVLFIDFSEILSTICITELAWSYVLHRLTKFPIGFVSLRDVFRSLSCFYSSVRYRSAIKLASELACFMPGSWISFMSLID